MYNFTNSTIHLGKVQWYFRGKKRMSDKYGYWVTAPFQPTGPDRETADLCLGGVAFQNFRLDFLAFLCGHRLPLLDVWIWSRCALH